MALLYIIYTILQFMGIDSFIISCITDVSIFTWIYLYLNSIIYKYCYVHRLPLYYIAINELITCIDYYINIPINDFSLLVLHLILIGILMYAYSIYYNSCRKQKYVIDNQNNISKFDK